MDLNQEGFLRTRWLLGEEAMRRLEQSRVSVIGLGGVGQSALEASARLGIGRFQLVDFDTIRPSNLNRQLLALASTMGRKKVEVAEERLLQINSHCRVEVFDGFCVPETLDAIFQEPPDCVLDAIDSLHPKVRLIHYCVQHGIPIITCLGSALRLDPGRIRVADLSQTKGCPLAKQVRARLGRLGIRNGVRCVYSDEPLKAQPQSPGPEDSTVERGRVRNTLASAVLVPNAVGLFAAAQVLACLLEKNS